MSRANPRLPMLILALVALSLATMVGIPGKTPAAPDGPLPARLELLASGFDKPVDLADPGDGSGRLLIVEQTGAIRILRGGAVEPDPFLDLSDSVSIDSEQGLLGLALHPDFASNGRFVVDYTDVDGDTRIVAYDVDPTDPDRADPASAREILVIPQPYRNHNGGDVHFGPDGMLYIGMGDGGAGGDPNRNGQNPDTLLGAILRIDIDGATDGPYAIPADNPYATGGGAPEVWITGLRNPWRFSFDRATGDLWIGDVGQERREEVDFLPAGTAAGANLGWNVLEGDVCLAAETCDRNGMVMPVHVYPHEGGACSITGGYRYRGEAIPALTGVYLFGDYCSGVVSGLAANDDGSWGVIGELATGGNVSSFAEDAAGEIYVLTLGGDIYRLVAA